MAAADKNVRPKRQAPAVTARGARRSGLARLLLQLLELLQLDRKLLLLFAASLMPACIIPVGPNWQDPPGERNHAPEIVSITPPVGMIVTTSVGFRVVFSDPDGDPLFFRWLAEAPPIVQGISFIQPVDDHPPSMEPAESKFPAECGQLQASRTTHQIKVGISDRPFIVPDKAADALTTVDGSLPIEFAWTLEKACSAE